MALCVCAAEGSAWAQAAPTEYHAVLTYIMTAPGMQDAYRDQLVNVSTKFYEEMLKEQPTLVHWSVNRPSAARECPERSEKLPVHRDELHSELHRESHELAVVRRTVAVSNEFQ